MISKIISKITLVIFIVALNLFSFDDAKAEQSEVKVLVDELTTTPEREQLALDQLAKFKDEELIELFPYFSDRRALASEDIKFLNISRHAPEEYYMTRAVRVNDVLVRYVCWRTARCVPTFDPKEIDEVKRQLENCFKHAAKH
jgi:hypothetical protein